MGVVFYLFFTFTLSAAPQPGDVFKEYHITGGGPNGSDEKWMDNHVFISHHTGERSTPGEHAFEVNWPGPAIFIEYEKQRKKS